MRCRSSRITAAATTGPGQRPAAGFVDARDQAFVGVETQRDLFRL